jgi:DUF1365 family protein
MALVYLDEVDVLVERGALSRRRLAARSLLDDDHLRDRPEGSLDARVRALVEDRCGRRPEGPIALLTQLRCWGLSFDPIRLYYCFAQDGSPEAVVAEVTNTPWGERHAYVLDLRGARRGGNTLRVDADKVFHVSPFFGMDHRYQFQIGVPRDVLALGIVSLRGGQEVFRAGLTLERRSFDRAARRRTLARHPWMPAETLVAIYWQALRLWLRGAPFHPHPDRGNAAPVVTEVSR